MVILEAWSVGRPVVASDIAAIRSVVRDGVDAVLVPTGDSSRLADEVLRLLSLPELAGQLGTAGRNRVEAEFSWSAVIDRWDSVLHDAVGASTRAVS